MQILFDADGRVEGYAEVGGIPGAVEYAGAVPAGFGPDTCRFYRLEGGALVYDAAKRQAELDTIAAAEELAERLEWFEWYDLQVKEYERAQRLGEPFDGDIMALDEQAKENAARIRELREVINTNNACYKAGVKMKPKGLMLHSTGANNPKLSRYIAPDDGLLGPNVGGQHFNQDSPGGRHVCPHAFIGLLKDGLVATYQTLPWDMRGWHSGAGPKGQANDGYIGVEICEDDLKDPEYFAKVYHEAAELFAYLCRMYTLSPDKPGIICHSEGHALGIASNHADVMHWFPKHGKSMDTFRPRPSRRPTAYARHGRTRIRKKARSTASATPKRAPTTTPDIRYLTTAATGYTRLCQRSLQLRPSPRSCSRACSV